ncbi:MAG: amidohydrolase [Bacteroidales bacterium]|nr:amidohydrolase [Bacteroidales bacterium]MBN2819231.1 amidohydrolase [Bacteroidales bacterium]
MIKEIAELASRFFEDSVRIRRYLHGNPELSFQEYQTTKFIKEQLAEYGIPLIDIKLETGTVGILKCKNPDKKVIALRSDIDALPIQEDNQLEYASKADGVMHACGHDAHMAILLGAARILSGLKNDIEGTILFIFQPAEETLPGGAKQIIESGAISNPKPEIIIGQHVIPDMTSGVLGFKAGEFMASTDEVTLSIKGKGGHAAMPHQITDTILITSHIIVALQQIVSRKAYAATPTVLSFGKIDAPGRDNIIPSVVTVYGTLRTMDETWRYEAHKLIKKISESVAEGMGARCEVEITIGYPALINDNNVTEKVKHLAKEAIGESSVEDINLRMISEDFAYYAQFAPSCFYYLGVKPKDSEEYYPLHSSKFNIDERALKTGITALSYIAAGLLKQKKF